ncbi:MAG: helical backbone metal receptor, partial [Acidobacteriota bacterium]|nr:helical backbone metal receptor [Acidobacteriota bacterium]
MRRKQIGIFILVCAIFGGTGSSCETQPKALDNAAEFETITDDLGNEFRRPDRVTRIVSLAPNLTEIVFALGAGDSLVGVTTFCDYPAEAARIKKVGDTLKPNIETIVGLKPQFVLVTTASQLESFSDLLTNQGIEVFVTNPDSIESLFRGITKIGDLVGKIDAAAELVSNIKSRLKKAAEFAAQKKGSRGVFVQIDKSLYTIGKGSFISDALSKIGFTSVTDDIDSPYPKISQELARTLNPDIIVISESVGNDAPNEVFRSSVAVRNGRVYNIGADVLSRPGPRFVEALELLVA